VSIRGLLTLIGGGSAAVGVAAIAYAHLAVAPDLERSVDVLRRVADDCAATIAVLSEIAAATDAVRAPGEDVTRRSVAALKPAIAMLEALGDTLRAVPGTGAGATSGVAKLLGGGKSGGDGAPDLPGTLAKLDRTVGDLTDEVRRLRTASLAFEAGMDRHETPSLRPTLAAAAARVRETQTILADDDPARGMTMLADLIAGIYVVVGAALVVVARAA
jgi:hypothetical protein